MQKAGARARGSGTSLIVIVGVFATISRAHERRQRPSAAAGKVGGKVGGIAAAGKVGRKVGGIAAAGKGQGSKARQRPSAAAAGKGVGHPAAKAGGIASSGWQGTRQQGWQQGSSPEASDEGERGAEREWTHVGAGY